MKIRHGLDWDLANPNHNNILNAIGQGGITGGAPDDDNPDPGDQDPKNQDPAADDDKGESKKDESAAELARLRKERDAAVAKVAKKEEADRLAKEEAKRKKAAEDGKLQALTEEQAQELERLRKERDDAKSALEARAKRQVEALPEEEQERLTRYKERVPIDVWLEMVDDVSAKASSSEPKPPAPRPPGAPGKAPQKDGYEVSEEAKRVLGDLGYGEAASYLARTERTVNEMGKEVWRMPIYELIDTHRENVRLDKYYPGGRRQGAADGIVWPRGFPQARQAEEESRERIGRTGGKRRSR